MTGSRVLQRVISHSSNAHGNFAQWVRTLSKSSTTSLGAGGLIESDADSAATAPFLSGKVVPAPATDTGSPMSSSTMRFFESQSGHQWASGLSSLAKITNPSSTDSGSDMTGPRGDPTLTGGSPGASSGNAALVAGAAANTVASGAGGSTLSELVDSSSSSLQA